MLPRHTSKPTADLVTCVLRAAWLSTLPLFVSIPLAAEPRAAIQVSAQVIDTTASTMAAEAIQQWLKKAASSRIVPENDLTLGDGLLRIGFATPIASHPGERLILIEFVAN